MNVIIFFNFYYKVIKKILKLALKIKNILIFIGYKICVKIKTNKRRKYESGQNIN